MRQYVSRETYYVKEWVMGVDRWERLLRAHPVNSDFTLRALAAGMLLQRRKLICRCAAKKPVVHANRSERERIKDQVADKAAFRCRRAVLAKASVDLVESVNPLHMRVENSQHRKPTFQLLMREVPPRVGNG